MSDAWPRDPRPYAPADPGLIAVRQGNKPAEYIPVPVIFADEREPRFFLIKRQAVIWNPWVNAWDTETQETIAGRHPTWEAADARAQQLNRGME